MDGGDSLREPPSDASRAAAHVEQPAGGLEVGQKERGADLRGPSAVLSDDAGVVPVGIAVEQAKRAAHHGSSTVL